MKIKTRSITVQTPSANDIGNRRKRVISRSFPPSKFFIGSKLNMPITKFVTAKMLAVEMLFVVWQRAENIIKFVPLPAS